MEDSYDNEISGDSGSFNFPWTLPGKSGIANAHYKLMNGNLHIIIMQITNENGKNIRLGAPDTERLKKQALDFIGNE